MANLTVEEQKTEAKKLIAGLAEDFKPSVELIEKKIATTQNRYGDYMALLSNLTSDRKVANLYATALIEAGANKQGVISAMQVMFA